MEIKQRIGRYVDGSSIKGESYKAYIPKPLPLNPPLDITKIYPLLEQANIAIGRLDGVSRALPNLSLLLYMYIRKEAVLSSQIEGTQSSLSDLLLFETEEALGVPLNDVREVSCYVSAMNYGLKRVKELPLSLRLLREIHAKLMNNTRGGNKQPGEFRSSQNWIGGSSPNTARFIPPPPEYLMECLDNFEKFLHDKKINLPILIKAALAHVQFETIHPFLDGNGRLGRLLITLILCVEGVLEEPLLYLSLYLKSNRDAYYNHLQLVRETGDWEAWVEFFLIGVTETAQQATITTQSAIDLFSTDLDLIKKSGKSTSFILKIYQYLQHSPVTTTNRIKQDTQIHPSTILRSLKTLEKLNIVREVTRKERHKIFVYHNYMSLLN